MSSKNNYRGKTKNTKSGDFRKDLKSISKQMKKEKFQIKTYTKEFETFEDALTKTKKHLQQVDSDLETLVGVRTRAINKQLMNVGEDSITDSTAARISTGK